MSSSSVISGVLLVSSYSARALAQEEFSEESSVDSRGEIAVETRAFLPDDNPVTRDFAAGLFSRLEFSHDHEPLKERVRAFARVDRVDLERSTLVVEEAWAQLWAGWFKLRAGLDIFNWTATEAFHPVDVLNARNLDSDLESLEKIGEPTVLFELSLPTDTTFELYLLPAYMAPLPPANRSRLNPVAGTPIGGRILVDRDGRFTTDDFGPQAAVRIRQVWGSADLSLHALEHMDRSQPVFTVDGAGVLRPVFFTVRQLGGTYQHALGGLLVKLEAAYRDFMPLKDPAPVPLAIADHGAVALGLEYMLSHESGLESTLIAEGQAVLGTSEIERFALTPFQRDVLGGYRLAFNDEDGKELLATAIVDLERRKEFLVNLAYQQRLGETWGIKLGARLIHSSNRNDPAFGLAAFREADLVRLTLTRYF